MPYLEKFTADQKDLLIALPYRVGVWVSRADESGGAESEARELQALESIITGYAEDFLKSEFVEEVMKQTLVRKERWPAWCANMEAVADECASVSSVLETHLSVADSLSYRQSLLDVATTVAEAYCEFDENALSAEASGAHMRYRWACFLAHLKKEPPPVQEKILNVSRAERRVLRRMTHALQLERAA